MLQSLNSAMVQLHGNTISSYCEPTLSYPEIYLSGSLTAVEQFSLHKELIKTPVISHHSTLHILRMEKRCALKLRNGGPLNSKLNIWNIF